MITKLQNQLQKTLFQVGHYKSTKEMFKDIDPEMIEPVRKEMCQELTELAKLILSMGSVEIDKPVNHPHPF